eukprot:GFKZ01001598.1.p1 GENE.GFKZ01001598.1~~GFKZ01001598.1.p1  ORF type:complete len:509 (+),score=96.71 GFKZ01001598.1:236-1762(+)
MALSIVAKCFNGQQYDLSFPDASVPVTELQNSISAASGITPERQTILFKGQVLEPGSSTADYRLTSGSTISVVRRISKASSKSAPPKPVAKPAPTESSPPPASSATQPSLEEMMRSMNVGGGAGNKAAPPPDLASLLGGAGGAGAGMPDLSALMGGGNTLGGGAPPASMEQLFAQLPQMMNGLMRTPMLQEFLNDPEKQAQSRQAILTNPLLKGLLDSDPEFAKVVEDPDKWKASMQAARNLFDKEGDEEGAKEGGEAEAGKESLTERAMKSMGSRQLAADMAPPGADIKKLSEAYGHALGQSLVNGGLGLDPDLVIQGLRSAVDGKAFPMALSEYERSMVALQNSASEFLTKANLEDANNLFEEMKQEMNVVMLEDGKIAYERTEIEPDESLPAAEEKSTVLVIVTARLLDGRHFFTCPAADDSGKSVHPLTLALDTAPRALAKGIVGMRENESRLLYVHPTACEGMAEMFGDLLPPNALLIFDMQLVSANAPEEEETVGEAYYNKH